uniref:KASH domain-containing protein n=2 Tax=Cuerna arida TaxID=1464854 RepID=A0A1B6EWZ8_9HEMI
MPGGFENSAMKSSFSLSSLQPSSASLETPEHARPERPYNSLRKTCRKDPEQESWRRSWDRKEDTKDEFWNALKPNYLYLMDSNLIDSCKEAGRDLHYGPSPTHDWSFEQFCTQFTELDLWLTSIQETIYSKEENVTDRNLRLSHVEEMHRKTYKRKVFNNQGGRLAARFPELKDDVKWRMAHLNRKWERLEQTVTPRKRSHPDHLTHAIDVEHELNCLRKWLRLTERRLLPLNFRATWTLSELEVKAKEHQVIQREVELHGKIVCSVLKRCDRLVQVEAEAGVASPVNLPSRGRRFDSNQAIKAARDLERRWQYLYIRSLEWLCHIENETKRAKNKSPVSVSVVDSDEGEPVHKYPRLSCSPWPDQESTTEFHDVDGDYVMDVSSAGEMVGPQSELNLSLPPSSCKSPPPPSLINRSGSMQIPAEEDVINENYPFHKSSGFDSHTRRQSEPVETARKLFSDETSFTRSERPARNYATFYSKHPDTESEREEGLMETDTKNSDISSEEDEDWTYKPGMDGEDSPVLNDDSSLCHSTETLSSVPKPVKPQVETLTKPKLKKLIEGAEVIAHSSPTRSQRIFLPLIFDSTRSKSKVSDWMRVGWDPEDGKTQGESCDASGEYTTEEEGHSAHSSGDFHTSVINCHQSAELIPTLDSPVGDKPSPSTIVSSSSDHFKISSVVLRTKRKDGTPKRPLSESGLPQLPPGMEEEKLLQSRSESALHQMDNTPTQSVKMDTSMHGTLSSSTTVEEMPSQTQEGSGGGYSSNSLRRRKIKLRKRNLGRKSDSGSDGHDPPSPLRCGPAIRRVPTSGTETEEEVEGESKLRSVRRKLIPPATFRLGPDNGVVTVYSCADKALSADSSFSEQAWDNYQEKYMSEAYSEETPDQETTRRLLEFGDDYRNYLDSQSDGASSLGFPRPGFNRRRRQLAVDRESLGLDSDSEGQEVRNLIAKSQSQLTFSEQAWVHLSNANSLLVLAKDFAEIISTCKDNIGVLKIFLENVGKDNEFVEECREIRGLMERWESLEGRSEELQKARSLQREMGALREELLDLTRRVTATESDNLQDRDQLDLHILNIKGEQANLSQRKKQLLEINTAVHKFFTDSGQKGGTIEAAARLKDDVKDLYFVWDETNKRVSQQLERLTQLSAAWQTFESHLAELQVALRGDQNTLRLLHSALQQGPVSQDVASSVIDVAKVLSEKQDLCFQSVCALNNTTPVILSLPASTEGSLSDSGISDSGSEQESERERRLSALRRLARQLEAALSPNSQAIRDMAKRIEQTENELRGLQKTCRELIVRTAVCADARIQQQDSPSPSPSLVNRSKRGASGPESFLVPDDDDDDPGPGKRSAGWLWRVIRAALPFQMAILAIFCVACLLEPHCCDNINNLNFSLTPQLRYVRGPPPT